ncbi:hypothetical protein L1049_026049 [Liquidambar formosana]|uniref:Synaptonemal complex protein 1 n=1 Tax=Liquidambar formosana TaxID=63359 RepID=A0AAP0NG76_LIQFO
MHKLGFSGMKSLDQFKSLTGSVAESAKTFRMSSRPSSDSISSGSFANLKLTAEKLVREQASVKTDLEMANSKLKKSMEHIRTLEEKLQNAFNENAKLKVKQKEDEKLWKGLESKFSSTKTLCDQLTETLQHLAGQVQDAEKDKAFFEDKLSASTLAIDDLNHQMDGLSLKLESADETIRNREKELKELRIEKDEREDFYRDEQNRTTNLIEEKDAMIKQLEVGIAATKLDLESLNSRLGEVHLELKLKEDEFNRLTIYLESLEREKNDLQCSNEDFSYKLVTSLQEIKNLKDLVQLFTAKLIELDRQSLTFSDKFVELNSVYGSCSMLVQQEKDLAVKHAQQQYNKIHDQFLHTTLEKDALQLLNQDLNNKVIELQRVQESAMVQHAEECRLSEERIRRLESEAETLDSKKNETEMLVTKLEEKIDTLAKSSSLSENKMQDLLLKISALESEKKDITEKLQAGIQKKEEEIDILQKEIGKHEQHVDSLEKQESQLHNIIEEKEQLIVQYKGRERQLEEQKAESQSLLAATESKLAEAKKQYDLMLESKQLELSRHLKEISQKNDQAINDIRRKYEMEKLEIVNLEKEKVDKLVGEMERKCEQKLAECKEESRQYVMRVQEEHAAVVTRIQQEHDRKELSLKADHSEELKRVQLQSENELREKTMLLKNEHEAQVRALRCRHEDECEKLQEELDLQKSKEDRQRALLQLQWKVMSDKPKEDQEVNSEKDYSISSIKMRNSGGIKKSQRAPVRAENEEKDSPFLRATQTPVSNLLKKVETANTGSVMSIPKHSRKVTHREYEVETSNGRTITKRRKTKSTVMFGDPRKQKKINTPKANTPRDIVKGVKGGGHQHPSNIGDLFTEGSLNPYTDDPYAFD